MKFSHLPNEIIVHVLQSCNTIEDVLCLASTCHHLQAILQAPSNRIPTLFAAAESQYGPLTDAVRLVTHNASQPAHAPRAEPPQSLALLRQLTSVGRVAEAWTELYPCLKWRGEASSSRRFLKESERCALRRAVYRSWLYSIAFHTPTHDRTTRRVPPMLRQRAMLLHLWSTSELAELLDLQLIYRQILTSTITPSNATVVRKHKQRHPDDPFPLVSVTHPGKYASLHNNFNLQSRLSTFHSTPHSSHLLPFAPTEKYTRTQRELHGTTLEGWGDEITHYYVLEDMLKLHPGQLLYLYSTIMDATQGNFHPGQSAKGLVESFVAGLEGGGGWFENNGETMGETIGFVIGERGGRLEEVRAAVEEGVWGVTCDMGGG